MASRHTYADNAGRPSWLTNLAVGGISRQTVEWRQQFCQIALDNTPHQTVVYGGVAMNEHIADGNDARQIGNSVRKLWIKKRRNPAKASPMISNCRSTAERSISSDR